MKYLYYYIILIAITVKIQAKIHLPSISINHYPDNPDKARPCAQRKYSVRSEVVICVPNNNGGFTEDSENNCKGTLKDECPEFNQADCMWFDIIICDIKYTFPVCRLKYFARNGGQTKYTWMEIHYVNQFGTFSNGYSNAMPAIIELSRKIKRSETFRDKDQPNFPGNVNSSTEVKGLGSHLLEDADKLLKIYEDTYNNKTSLFKGIQPSQMCNAGKEIVPVCTTKLRGFFQQFFSSTSPTGIEGYHGNNLNNDKVECGMYIIDGIKKNVCRNYLQARDGGARLSQYVLEFQVYIDNNKPVFRIIPYGGNSLIPPDGEFTR